MLLLYIDPGTGSMLFSLAFGIISVAWFGLRKLYMKLKYLSPVKTKKDEKSVPLVIFSDDKRYWKYFEPVCCELNDREFDTVYMTMSEDDPVFDCPYQHIMGQYIGPGNKAYGKLNILNATMVLSTTPGLEVYQWKRSHDVKCYIYLPHAANALTTVRMFGIDFFDAILVSGQYQIDIVRKLEKLRKEPAKELVPVGIPYMDEILDRIEKEPQEKSDGTTVLLAPSWGKSAILSRFGGRIIQKLVEAGYHIIIRPHPQSFVSEKEMIEELMREFPESDHLEWNRDVDNFSALKRSDILISDFSGVVFEYALAFDKPVICVDTNFDDSQYDSCWLDETNWSIENLPKLGAILKEEELDKLKEMIDSCLSDKKYKELRQDVSRDAWVHRGEGAKRVADYLATKYRDLTGESTETKPENSNV